MKAKLWMSAVAISVAACGSPEDGTNNANNGEGIDSIPTEPATYEFPSRFEEGADSVSYSGQIGRQVLISDLATFIGSLTDAIDSGDFVPSDDGSVVSALDFYYRFDGETYGSESLLTQTEPAAEQTVYDEIATGRDLAGKMAGNDTATDHKDWSTEFVGWSDTSFASNGGDVTTPEGLLTAFFGRIEDNAFDRADGEARFAPDGETELAVHITEEGHDLQQLVQKFLIGAVAFSQGADDYLDDDVDGKGLLTPNTRDEEKTYTGLEHHWDEGFGYFGAARNYLDYTDEEIAGKGGREGWSAGYHDTNGDGAIDLTSEYNWGASTNAAKRDLGSTTGTDFTKETFEAFWRGRAIIARAEGETLTEDELADLREQRDIAVLGWEKALAATVVHYINDTIDATEAIGSEEYSFAKHAKVWSELKGFALAFQFNPRSPMSDGDFAKLHTLVGDAPQLDAQNAAAYIADLESARTVVANSYGFETADVEAW